MSTVSEHSQRRPHGHSPRHGHAKPDPHIIVLFGAGLSGVWFLHVPWLVHVAMWVLAVASLITLGQRLHAVRTSPGAMEPLRSDAPPPSDAEEPSDA